MDPAQWGPQASSCTPLQTNGPNGPDRVISTRYDALGRADRVQTAVGTSAQSDEATVTYTPNGQQATLTDGNGNTTSYEYDGFDRLVKMRYPNPSGGGSSSSDYVALGYDSRGNVVTRSLRGNPAALTTITYDALNRPTHIAPPGGSWADPAKDFAYDNVGNLIQATSANTHARFQSFDALGRKTYQADSLHGASMQYDAAGRRTRLTWYDGFYVTYDYDVLGELTAIRENGTTPLVTFAYNDLGQRTSLTRANGTTTSYGYDAISRLTSLTQDLGGTGQDLALGFSYNPANQIAGSTRSNDLYAWAGHYNVDRPYAINGLNQVTAAGGVTPVYDNKGNMRSGAGVLYDYNVDNQLGQVTPSDPAQPTLRFNYAATGELESIGDHLGFEYLDGQMITEVSDAPGFPIQRRYIYGPGADEPLVWYEGGGTTQPYWLHADERGSVVAVTDTSGNALGTNSYDEYGIPAANNLGRFQYTGQIWVPEIGLYYYKARMYSPTYGRFMQTDPIGYGAGVNMYAYVGADPINVTDPDGMQAHEKQENVKPIDPPATADDIIVTATRRICQACKSQGSLIDKNPGLTFGNGPGAGGDGGNAPDIVVVAPKRPPKKEPNPRQRNQLPPGSHLDPKGHDDVCRVASFFTGDVVGTADTVAGTAALLGETTALKITGRLLLVPSIIGLTVKAFNSLIGAPCE